MTKCSACESEVIPGTRWCSFCHTNIANPSLGKLAAPGSRLGAYLLDFAVPIFTAGVIAMAVGIENPTGIDAGAGIGTIAGGVLFIAYILWALKLFAGGMTPGKRLLGMRVIREDGTPAGFILMLIRETIGKFISGMILSLGFLWILFDKENQGWHDKLMSTYVTR